MCRHACKTPYGFTVHDPLLIPAHGDVVPSARPKVGPLHTHTLCDDYFPGEVIHLICGPNTTSAAVFGVCDGKRHFPLQISITVVWVAQLQTTTSPGIQELRTIVSCSTTHIIGPPPTNQYHPVPLEDGAVWCPWCTMYLNSWQLWTDHLLGPHHRNNIRKARKPRKQCQFYSPCVVDLG